jgi:hypothetical protein
MSPSVSQRGHAAPDGPLLTPIVIRRLAHWSQVKLAAAAGTSVATVRLYEADEMAVVDPGIRRSLGDVYARLKIHILTRPQSP